MFCFTLSCFATCLHIPYVSEEHTNCGWLNKSEAQHITHKLNTLPIISKHACKASFVWSPDFGRTFGRTRWSEGPEGLS